MSQSRLSLKLLALAAVVALSATSCAPCYYRMDSQGYYKSCGGVVKCTSPNKLPNADCK